LFQGVLSKGGGGDEDGSEGGKDAARNRKSHVRDDAFAPSASLPAWFRLEMSVSGPKYTF
jgi:hypothetical protein